MDTRKGFYPDDIAGTFGVPVEEHLRESEVRQMDGYVSMGVLTGRTVLDTGLDYNTKGGSAPFFGGEKIAGKRTEMVLRDAGSDI